MGKGAGGRLRLSNLYAIPLSALRPSRAFRQPRGLFAENPELKLDEKNLQLAELIFAE
jgi:hypothetical protein